MNITGYLIGNRNCAPFANTWVHLDLFVRSMLLIFLVFCKKSLKIPKVVIRIRKTKDRQHNDQKKKDRRTNNDLQNIHIKI